MLNDFRVRRRRSAYASGFRVFGDGVLTREERAQRARSILRDPQRPRTPRALLEDRSRIDRAGAAIDRPRSRAASRSTIRTRASSPATSRPPSASILRFSLARSARPECRQRNSVRSQRRFPTLGAFVYVPADAAADEPVVVTYDVPGEASVFPYTVVLAERGARTTVIERFVGGAGAFVCGATEIVTERTGRRYVRELSAAGRGRARRSTRAARPGRDATVSWACAELGAGLDGVRSLGRHRAAGSRGPRHRALLSARIATRRRRQHHRPRRRRFDLGDDRQVGGR